MRQLVQSSAANSPEMNMVTKLVKSGRDSGRPFLDILILSLNALSLMSFDVYFIIDGLDECSEREDLIESLPVLAKNNARLLVTSRPEIDIAQAWGERPQLEMESEAINVDIAKHVESRFEYDKKLSRTGSSLKKKIINELVLRSSGM
jgi:hypothetical protein